MGRDRGDGEESGPVRGQQMSQLPEGRVGELDALDARHGTLLRGMVSCRTHIHLARCCVPFLLHARVVCSRA